MKNKFSIYIFCFINFLQAQSIWIGNINDKNNNTIWHNNPNSIQLSWDSIPNSTTYEIAIGLSETFPTEILNWTLFNGQNFNPVNINLREATITQIFFEGYDYYFFIRNASNIEETLTPLGPIKMDFTSPITGSITLKNNIIDDYPFINNSKIQLEWCGFIDLIPSRGEASNINRYDFNIINDTSNDTIFSFFVSNFECEEFKSELNIPFFEKEKYHINIFATDLAGNISSSIKSKVFQYDITAPSSGFVNDINSESISNDDINFSNNEQTIGAYWNGFNDDLGGSNIRSYKFEIYDNLEILQWDTILPNNLTNFIIPENAEIEIIDQMKYKFHIIAIDSALNESESSISNGIVIDASKPVIKSITTNNSNSYLYPNILNNVTIEFSEKVYKPKIDNIIVQYTINTNLEAPIFYNNQPFDTTTRVDKYELTFLPSLISNEIISISINDLIDLNNLSNNTNGLIQTGIQGDLNNDYEVNNLDIDLYQDEWSNNTENSDIGPAEGDFPYIKTNKDKTLDINDMKIFYKMWKFFNEEN